MYIYTHTHTHTVVHKHWYKLVGVAVLRSELSGRVLDLKHKADMDEGRIIHRI